MTIQRSLISFIVAASLAAAQSNNPDAALGAARHLEEAEGNYPAAIEAYKKFVTQYGKNRALAAKALIRMAECHQKLGNAEARVIYERVLREYSDQKDAVSAAKARLGGGETLRAKGDRAVWTGPRVDLFGRVSADGRFITYIDWITGVLFQHDLGRNSDRPLTNVGTPPYTNGFAQFSTISKDSKQVAYEWYTEKNEVEIRTVGVQGSGIPQPQRVFANEDVRNIAPYYWSPDGKLLAVHLRRKDQSSQIGLVMVQDGSLRVLKSVDWRGPSKIFFSPDGKYIAYDLPTNDSADRRDVFVMAIDGSRETVAVAHPSNNIIMGWSPDGHFLLFSSDRTGSAALWALPLAVGKPQGAPERVKPETSNWSFGLTRSGALYVLKTVGRPEIRVAAVDWNSGKLISAPVNAEPTYIESRGNPDWSRDGKHLSYVSCGETGGGPCKVRIQSSETGKVRELPAKLWYVQQPRWSPDDRSFITAGRDNKGRGGIYQIDAESGDATLITGAPLGAQPQWSLDGQKIYYRLGSQIRERELSSGNEKKVFESPARLGAMGLSPDGRYCIATTTGPGNKRSVLLISLEGGETRDLVQPNSVPELSGFRFVGFTPDSRDVMAVMGNGERRELWLFPINDGQPRNVEIDAKSEGQLLSENNFSLNPDGRRIAFVAGKGQMEVWAFENFLPNPSEKR